MSYDFTRLLKQDVKLDEGKKTHMCCHTIIKDYGAIIVLNIALKRNEIKCMSEVSLKGI